MSPSASPSEPRISAGLAAATYQLRDGSAGEQPARFRPRGNPSVRRQAEAANAPGGGVFARFWRSVVRVAQISDSRRLSRTLRYVAKCAIRPRASLRWLQALEHSPLGDFLDRQPRLLLKPHRAYISHEYGFSRRAAALLNHHALAGGLRAVGKAAALPAGREQVLAEIVGKNGNDRYLLTIGATDKFDREGEVMLALRDAGGGDLVQVLVFTLAIRDAMPCVEIGCLQGGRAAQSQAIIKRATKALHGIRPKNLLLDAIYALARGWDMAAIYGVSNANRIYRSKYVHSDYDEFWRELGGRADRDGFFALPATLPEKTAIPSHRRAEYRRRAEVRGELDAQIQAWIARGGAERRAAQREGEADVQLHFAAAA